MPENEKALRYISQLDDARCNARWDAIPELARKVEKHAPHRTCLYLTARAEAETAAYIKQRPTTADATAPPSPPDLSKLISPLTDAYDGETTNPQDAFAAQVALAWIHFALGEYRLAVARFPNDFSETANRLGGGEGHLSGWAQVCIVKGAYLKGYSQERTGSTDEAIRTYESVLPYLSSIPSLSTASVQLRTWTESLLARLCILSDISQPAGAEVEPEVALRTFQLWLRLLDNGRAAQVSGDFQKGQISIRRAVWKAYYDTLSIILQRGLLYAGSPDSPTALLGEDAEHTTEAQYLSARLQQRSELKLVESVYEALLLKETRFPKASENNEEMDAWAEAVMNNWRILCGPNWTDEELGEGGKAAVGKGVLDILYRAATKTYHSTRILRHLFVVHALLAEFDLAFKAFDSYVEIVSRVKDRVEKSGEEDTGLDDDNIVIRTAAEAIRILCRFGAREEAEKAKEIGERIEKWLKQQTPASRPGTATSSGEHKKSTESVLSHRVLAIAYRAIGISRAHWARLTYEATARSTLQAQAAQAFRKALSPEYEDPNNLETLYALGLLLAEMRDISGAIKVIKRALASHSQPDSLRSPDGVASEEDFDEDDADFIRERKLIPLWHLLALLLTAKSDFSTAVRTCEAAFDQFDDPTVLFGKQAEYRSEHLNESTLSLEKPRGSTTKGLVDRMAAFEKEGMLQVKVTQLVLLEVVEGTAAAVDASMELLTLYKRLFGDPTGGQKKMQLPSMQTVQSPTETVKASVFGRRKNTLTRSTSMPPATSSSRPSTTATEGTAAPAIHVTDANGKSNGHHHHHSLFHHKQDSPLRRASLQLRKKKTNDSNATDKIASSEKAATEPAVDGSARHGSEKSSSPEQPLRPIAHNISHNAQPRPAGHSDQPPVQDSRLPAPFPRPNYSSPEPLFPALQERRHATSLLVDVWLFIAGLYARASLFEDARGAVDEAFKLTDILESEIAQESSSAKAFAERGWGGGKSVEELWADIWATRGEISQAESEHHEALAHFEKSLSHNPDHPAAIIGLSNILLDVYSQVVPAEPPGLSNASTIHLQPGDKPSAAPSSNPANPKSASPEELNRLAARDRAYTLLSSLTKLGTGWDNSEAWFALARAYEEGGQIEKAKEVLWWCVELEDSKALRKWSCVGVGGFVL